MEFHHPLRILVVEDDPLVAQVLNMAMSRFGHTVVHAASLSEAVQHLSGGISLPAIALIDVRLGGENGFDLLSRFRWLTPEVEFVMMSGDPSPLFPIEAMRNGAAGYISKPIGIEGLKHEIERVAQMRRSLLLSRDQFSQLQSDLEARTREYLRESGTKHALQRNLIQCLCRLAEFRDNETGSHIKRMAEYCRHLAFGLRFNMAHVDRITDRFINRLYTTAPLHDIGKAGIPDTILLKPGSLTPEEFAVMKTHSLIGREILADALQNLHDEDAELIHMGMEICASHHEKWDGTGYPAGLREAEIPIAARIVALADFYDALSTPRVYRPEPFSHERIKAMILEQNGRHFDPDVVGAFLRAEDQFLKTRERLVGD